MTKKREPEWLMGLRLSHQADMILEETVRLHRWQTWILFRDLLVRWGVFHQGA